MGQPSTTRDVVPTVLTVTGAGEQAVLVPITNEEGTSRSGMKGAEQQATPQDSELGSSSTTNKPGILDDVIALCRKAKGDFERKLMGDHGLPSSEEKCSDEEEEDSEQSSPSSSSSSSTPDSEDDSSSSSDSSSDDTRSEQHSVGGNVEEKVLRGELEGKGVRSGGGGGGGGGDQHSSLEKREDKAAAGVVLVQVEEDQERDPKNRETSKTSRRSSTRPAEGG